MDYTSVSIISKEVGMKPNKVVKIIASYLTEADDSIKKTDIKSLVDTGTTK